MLFELVITMHFFPECCRDSENFWPKSRPSGPPRCSGAGSRRSATRSRARGSLRAPRLLDFAAPFVKGKVLFAERTTRKGSSLARFSATHERKQQMMFYRCIANFEREDKKSRTEKREEIFIKCILCVSKSGPSKCSIGGLGGEEGHAATTTEVS